MKISVRNFLSKMTGPATMHSLSDHDLQLLKTVKQELLPKNYKPQENFVPKRQIGNAGFSLNVESQLELIRSFQKPELCKLFQSLRNNEIINVGLNGKEYKSRGLIHNGYYPTPDAELYAAMISSFKPNTIIEIGSGFSTVIARTTVDYFGLDCKIHVIDPQPRRDIENIADHIEYKPVEHSSLADVSFSKNTLLFIDSSHVCRSEGDLPFLYCRILPTLPAGVLIHIHDIFLPFDYPDSYYKLFYTEEYLLHALLAHSSKFEVVLTTHYLTRKYKEIMQAVFGHSVGEDPLFFGASFWMRSREQTAGQCAAHN